MARKKELSSYFPHDSNARNSEKLLELRMQHGAAGYGVYFMLIERLREAADYSCVVNYNSIAFDLRVSAELIKSVLRDFRLFAFFQTDEGERFYSESLRQRMKPMDEMRVQRRNAAAISVAKRKERAESQRSFNARSTLVAENENTRSTDVTQKSNKVKESKGDNNSSNNNKREARSEEPRSALNLEPLQPAASTRTQATIREVLTSNQIWSNAICSNHRISPETFNEYVTKFEQHCFIENRTHNTDGDVQVHFNNWLRIQLNIQATKSPKQSNYGTSRNYRPSADENRRRQEERTANIERRLQEAIYDTSDIPAGSY
jgi:hypothetical protein|nr:MAG TPA: protein of unknown function (DUF4373) [Caudoviricetes sp.]